MRVVILLVFLLLPLTCFAEEIDVKMSGVIEYLYAEANTGISGNVELRNDLDKNGTYIERWGLKEPKPTKEYLKSKLPEYLAWKDSQEQAELLEKEQLLQYLKINEEKFQKLKKWIKKANK